MTFLLHRINGLRWSDPVRELLGEIWGPTHEKDTHYLRIYMKQLRDKLEIDPVQPCHLVTETGVGYRLVSDD